MTSKELQQQRDELLEAAKIICGHIVRGGMRAVYHGGKLGIYLTHEEIRILKAAIRRCEEYDHETRAQEEAERMGNREKIVITDELMAQAKKISARICARRFERPKP